MKLIQRAFALVREAALSAWAQKVSSTVSIVIVVGMCASILLTTGRTVGAEDSVLASIDSAGTRSIVVRAESDAGLDSRVLDRLGALEGVEVAVAFGVAIDARNTAFKGGKLVPVRALWESEAVDSSMLNPGEWSDGSVEIVDGSNAWVSPSALQELGMLDPVGGITNDAGQDFAVTDVVSVPDFLTFLEPLVVVPQPPGSFGHVAVLVVIAEEPAFVTPVSRAVQGLLSVDEPSSVSVSTSENLATLRGLVEGQLGSFGRELMVIIFGVSAIFVASILYGFTMLRRKDYGRRRALGASRSLIVLLILLQMMMLSTVGAALGSGSAVIVLKLTNVPVPGSDFILAVAVLACAISTVAAGVPGVVASRRDPIRELRVP